MISLRQRMTEDMQVRNLALNTQTSYLQQVSLFARHFTAVQNTTGRCWGLLKAKVLRAEPQRFQIEVPCFRWR